MTTRPAPPVSRAPDVVVVGGGIVGLAIAFEAHAAGARVRLVDAGHHGMASLAAAGLLAPSLGALAPDARVAFATSASMFSDFCARVSAAAGREVRAHWGLLEIARGTTEADDMARHPSSAARILDRGALALLEPAVADATSARIHTLDGWVDPAELVGALRDALRQAGVIAPGAATVLRVVPGRPANVHFAEGPPIATQYAVVAAGAWSPLIAGVRSLPVDPVKGQLLQIRSPTRLHRAIAGGSGYLVPRADGSVIVGSTVEQAGFDAQPTAEGARSLRAIMATLSPVLASQAEVIGAWAGIRPMTPDRLPAIGPDPERAGIVYACGHGKNGVLLAPLTGAGVTGFLTAGTMSPALTAFSPMRFD